MKIMITGSQGQLGNEIIDIIKKGQAEIGKISEKIKNSQIINLDVNELDIADLKRVKKKLKEYNPDVVINCAAATNVDQCEIDEEWAFKINALGARNLAIAAEEVKAKLVHISTDYVFDGKGSKPLREYDLTNPKSVYGKTKYLGEEYVKYFSKRFFIVRTAWLYGYKGKNFVYTIMKMGKEKSSLNVVNDQIGNPTHANDLAYHILKLIETEEYGIYHCTGNGECTWYEFAKEIIKQSKLNCEINPCDSKEYKALAERPEYSALDNMMIRLTIGDEMRTWKEALKSFINNK